jgi:hypothetical protein
MLMTEWNTIKEGTAKKQRKIARKMLQRGLPHAQTQPLQTPFP